MGCIYKLIDGNDVVYVGQSKQCPPYQRVFDHAKNKIFTTYEFTECPNELLNTFEAQYISTLCPKYNKNKNPKYDRSTGVNTSLLDEWGKILWMDLQVRIALQPETAHLSESFKDFMDHCRSLIPA